MSAKKIVITGAYGLIANAFFRHLHRQAETYEVYGLARRRHPSERALEKIEEIPEDRFYLADLTDLNALKNAFEGADTVVQLAADPRPDASWESLLDSNVVGVRNVFEAAHQCGVRRVVLASSIMVSWGYQQDEPYKAISEGRFAEVDLDKCPMVTHESAPRPTGLYPASKVWAEALARYYADVHHLSSLCLRIGWVNAEDHPGSEKNGAFWCSQRDVIQLMQRSIEAPDTVQFDIFYGVSNSRWRWVDIEHPKRILGFVPQDSAEGKLQER
ncbi:MAG: hypothetical protein CME28_03605 [Gemmatimonadetes bacterium]|nr:hypothetical protein [Gemmatimonadota bacterium]